MILLAGALVIIVMLLTRALIPVYRRQRMRTQLPRDWWPRFERELRQYMSHTWQEARDAERHL